MSRIQRNRPRTSEFGPHRGTFQTSGARDLALEEGQYLALLDIASHERLADAADENERELAVANLLVLAHEADQLTGIGLAARNVADACRQAHGLDVTRHALGRSRRAKTQLLGEAERQADTDGDAFTVQQPVGIAGPGFKGVAERVAEVEKGAVAGLVLSRATMAALALTLVSMAVSSASLLERENVGPEFLEPGVEALRRPEGNSFATSAYPARISRAGSVFRTVVSASNRFGWWKTPMRFLPCGVLMPVLPLTEVSTWASRDVVI